MRDALQSAILKRYVFLINKNFFRVFSCLYNYFIFISCFELEASCLYRYILNTKHEVFVYRVPNSDAFRIRFISHTCMSVSMKLRKQFCSSNGNPVEKYSSILQLMYFHEAHLMNQLIFYCT